MTGQNNNKPEYKQTEIDRIPKDWEVVRLGEVLNLIRNGLVIKQNRNKVGIPVTRIETISDEKIDVKKVGYIEKLSEEEITEYRLQNGDILFSHINSLIHIGKTAIYDGTPPLLLHGMNLLLLRPQKTIVEPFYLLYLLKHYRNKAIFRHMAKKAVNQASINQTDLGRLKIPLPPLPEQQKIAEILSTVDTAIEKVDEAIVKTERLKKGLMQELLTKGIGHKEFKDTEIGRIPKEWEVVRLESLIKEIRNGFASGKRDNNGIVQIRMNNVTTDGQLILDSYLKVPIPDNVHDWLLKEGDFLFNNTNSYDLVGKSTIFKGAPFPCTFSNHFTRIRFKQDLVIPEIILYHFILLWEKGYFKSVAIRHVGQSAVHTKYLVKLKLPLPPLPEQQKIVEILLTVDKRLELLRNKKERLAQVKRGLMNDLLTGKKRVIL